MPCGQCGPGPGEADSGECGDSQGCGKAGRRVGGSAGLSPPVSNTPLPPGLSDKASQLISFHLRFAYKVYRMELFSGLTG